MEVIGTVVMLVFIVCIIVIFAIVLMKYNIRGRTSPLQSGVRSSISNPKRKSKHKAHLTELAQAAFVGKALESGSSDFNSREKNHFKKNIWKLKTRMSSSDFLSHNACDTSAGSFVQVAKRNDEYAGDTDIFVDDKVYWIDETLNRSNCEIEQSLKLSRAKRRTKRKLKRIKGLLVMRRLSRQFQDIEQSGRILAKRKRRPSVEAHRPKRHHQRELPSKTN